MEDVQGKTKSTLLAPERILARSLATELTDEALAAHLDEQTTEATTSGEDHEDC